MNHPRTSTTHCNSKKHSVTRHSRHRRREKLVTHVVIDTHTDTNEFFPHEKTQKQTEKNPSLLKSNEDATITIAQDQKGPPNGHQKHKIWAAIHNINMPPWQVSTEANVPHNFPLTLDVKLAHHPSGRAMQHSQHAHKHTELARVMD